MQLAGFLVALRAKGETVEELRGLAEAMLAHANRIEVARPSRRHRRHRRRPAAHGQHLDDGRRWSSPRPGSGWSSTATGRRRRPPARPTCSRRSASSSTCRPSRWPSVAEEVGHHLLLRPGVPPGDAPRRRRPAASSASPTAFNVLGPLTNPAQPTTPPSGVRRRADGAGDGRGVRRPRRDAAVFRGDDGLDELTTSATTSTVWWVRDGAGHRAPLDPARRSGSSSHPVEALRGGDAAAQRRGGARRCSPGERGPVRDAVLLNAGDRRWPTASGLAGHGVDGPRSTTAVRGGHGRAPRPRSTPARARGGCWTRWVRTPRRAG